MHLGGIRVLFGLRFEVEGLELAGPGPVVVMIRHASIIDNMVPDALVAHEHGLGLRYVIKRELRFLPVIDIGGRWAPTNFVRRASGDTEGEVERLLGLTEDLGAGEGILIYPEGTRHTDAKLVRAKRKIAESQPQIAPLAERLQHLLPPRLGGPLALLEATAGTDVVFCAHVGFDGFETVRDIWSGGLVGNLISVRFQRVSAAEIPTGREERIEWLYAHWQDLDDWIGAIKIPNWRIIGLTSIGSRVDAEGPDHRSCRGDRGDSRDRRARLPARDGDRLRPELARLFGPRRGGIGQDRCLQGR